MYSNFKDGGLSEVFEQVPGVILKQVYHGEFYDRTETAINIEKAAMGPLSRIPNKTWIRKKL